MNVITKHREGQFNISIRQASRYDMGRVFLAGDAAHIAILLLVVVG